MVPAAIGVRIGTLSRGDGVPLDVVCQTDKCLEDAVMLADTALFDCARNITGGEANLKQIALNVADTKKLIEVLKSQSQTISQKPAKGEVHEKYLSLQTELTVNALDRAKTRLEEQELRLETATEKQECLVNRCHTGLPELSRAARKIAFARDDKPESATCRADVDKWTTKMACNFNSCGAQQTWTSTDKCGDVGTRNLECPCCAVDAIYDENTPWEACSVKKCGIGFQERTRTILKAASCGGHEEDPVQQRLCNTAPYVF